MAAKKTAKKKTGKPRWQQELETVQQQELHLLAECVIRIAAVTLKHEQVMMKTNDRSETTDALMGAVVACKGILRA